MTKDAFLRQLEAALERPASSIDGSEALQDIDWDSLGVISFLALVDESLNIQVSAKAVNDCGTVRELLALLGDKIEA